MKKPYFSIIIPMYNREVEIRRAVDSCLSQGFQNFEIIIVDDGSTDDSVKAVQKYSDSRIQLICHEKNKGVCPARNTAIQVAMGRWIITLDSDNELLPESLSRLYFLTEKASPKVGKISSMVRWDTGQVTPDPGFPKGPVDYYKYLEWLNTLKPGKGETQSCIRREVFDRIMYHNGRAYETSFHLNVAREWLIDFCSEEIIIYHTDAENRICGLHQLFDRSIIAKAKDFADDTEKILQVHGDALRKFIPLKYNELLEKAAFYCFLDHRRMEGLRYSIQLIKIRPFSFSIWVILFSGLVHDRFLLFVNQFRRIFNRLMMLLLAGL